MMEVDIAIVGGGIVGATLAALLEQAGLADSYRIALIDAGEAEVNVDLAHFDPRVVALSRASQDILHRAQVWQSILATRACAYKNMYVWDAEGTGNIQFAAEDIHQASLGHIVENKVLMQALNQQLSKTNKVIQLRGKRLDGIEQGLNKHKLLFHCGEEVHAALVVGADGAKSRVREQANFSVKEWDYGQDGIVTTVETELSHEFCAWQRFTADGPLAFLPLTRDGSDSRTSSIVWSINKDVADQNMALDDDQFKEALGQAFEYRLGKITGLDKRFAIPLRQCFATHYAKTGIVLVGDAAHSIHPLAGQGVNMGLYDIQALCEELQRATQRKLSLREAATYRRYERRRQSHNLLAMSAMEIFKRGFGTEHIVPSILRNVGMKRVNEQASLKRIFSKLAAGA